MSTPPAGSLLRHLRRLLPPAGLAALTDRQLLERFAAVRDEAAFAALVERHGRLVLGVCRRLLGDAHEAEDVFQATFLVLARKADALRHPDAVASFLHGVAARLARKARMQRERRRLPERREVPVALDVPAAVARDEVCQVVDEELRRLPAHYRTPLVLCYLEGKSRQEAAAVLGCSEGAVKGKLERGRELLRARLVRRGVAAVPAALAAVEQPAGAAPAAWTAAAVQAAMAGRCLSGAAALADGLLRGMVAVKVKVGAGLLLLCVVGLGVGLAAWSGDAQPRTDRRGEPLPAGAIARLGDVRLAQEGPVVFVGFARKGQLVTAQPGFTAYCATCHAEPFNVIEAHPLDTDSFRVWDLERGRELRHFGQIQRSSSPGTVRATGRAVSATETALVWDIVGLRPDPKPVTLDERQLSACWQTQTTEDAERAWMAVNRLAAAPSQTVALLREHLPPVPVPDGKDIARLIADLEDSEFAVRERASAELEKLGGLAGPAIRRALEAKPPPESRRRLEALRERRDGRTLSAETLRAIRAVELLEQMNSPEARALLERLAGGAAEAVVTRQARAALDRLARQTPP
jgi:RNA polymerase sigma factor (sigma-70 family)